MSLTCIIVDDDEISRILTRRFTEKTGFITVKHEFSTAFEALEVLKEERIDLILLDVEMPGMSGLDLIRQIDEGTEVVMITSGKEYAAEAYDSNVVDYLLKPLEYNRFLKAAVRAKERIDTLKTTTQKQENVFVKTDHLFVRVTYNQITMVRALADYVEVVTTDKKYIIRSTMKDIEKKLPSNLFARVHRSYIVNLEKIDHFEEFTVSIQGKQVPIGITYKDNFVNRLSFL